jgi:hypothetical protein
VPTENSNDLDRGPRSQQPIVDGRQQLLTASVNEMKRDVQEREENNRPRGHSTFNTGAGL